MDESELYNFLGKLTREKDKWKESIPFLHSLLDNGSDKIKAKSFTVKIRNAPMMITFPEKDPIWKYRKII